MPSTGIWRGARTRQQGLPQGHKEFVYSFRRQKLSKQCRSAFVKEHSYPKLFMQHICSIFRVQMLRIIVGVFGSTKAFRAYVMDGTSADDDGISSPQQAHDETVRRVGTTDEPPA